MSWRDMVEVIASTSSGCERTRHTCPVCPYKVGVIDYKRSLSVDHSSGFVRCFRCNFRTRLKGLDDYDRRVSGRMAEQFQQAA
jgi:hypothetical protein